MVVKEETVKDLLVLRETTVFPINQPLSVVAKGEVGLGRYSAPDAGIETGEYREGFLVIEDDVQGGHLVHKEGCVLTKQKIESRLGVLEKRELY